MQIQPSDRRGGPARQLPCPGRLAALIAATIGSVACGDAAGPSAYPPVALAVEMIGTGIATAPSADGRLRSVIIRSGPGLNCGVSSARATSELRGRRLDVRLDFRPLPSCPFAPTEGRWDAVVTELAAGDYDVVVRQTYWPDLGPQQVLRAEAYANEY